MNDLVPAVLVPPGEILKDELDARGLSQKDFAEMLGCPEQAVSEIVRAKKQITPEMAVKIGAALGTSAELWMNLETNYRLRQARRRTHCEPIEHRSRLYQICPVRQMKKRGWIPDVKEPGKLEQALVDFFGGTPIAQLSHAAAAFRYSTSKEPDKVACLAWLKYVEKLAATQSVADFSLERLMREGIPRLLELARCAEQVSQVPATLADSGVRFVIEKHLDKTYLDGAAIGTSPSPIVALTLRHDRIDSFWFTLMHELAHLVENQDKTYLDDQDERRGKHEDRANRMAADWLIPPAEYRRFTRRKVRFSRLMIEEFAASINRHPGIVLGRLQRDGRMRYEQLRSLLVRVSPFLGGSTSFPAGRRPQSTGKVARKQQPK